MGVVLLFLLAIIIVVLFVAVGFFSREKNDESIAVIEAIFSVLGLGLLMIFSGLSADVLKSGSPVQDIKAGEYKVAFVYPGGSNVAVGIEQEGTNDDKKVEYLYLYQFPKDAFRSSIKIDAKKLRVWQDGRFKILILE